MPKLNTYPTQSSVDPASKVLSIIPGAGNTFSVALIDVNDLGSGGGAAGASAYEVAVANGFVGTQSAWLASLVGQAGPQGLPGAKGDTGDAGPQGLPGIPGADGTDGADGLSNQPVPVTNKGAGSGAQTFDVSVSSYQKLTLTGGTTVSITNWPTTGTLGELTIELSNGGNKSITWPANIRWIKADGTYDTNFATSGITLLNSGTNFICLWSHDAGTVIWAKVL